MRNAMLERAANGRHRAQSAAGGADPDSRVGGILAGSVATALLHRAPCSVLIARPHSQPGRFPAWIGVGIDGSEPSRLAQRVARDLGTRVGVPDFAVAASGAAADVEADGEISALDVDEREPVEALVDAAGRCDLLVLGARGLRGVRALGSVSERVAHRAPSSVSVLVVRRTCEAAQPCGAVIRVSSTARTSNGVPSACKTSSGSRR